MNRDFLENRAILIHQKFSTYCNKQAVLHFQVGNEAWLKDCFWRMTSILKEVEKSKEKVVLSDP